MWKLYFYKQQFKSELFTTLFEKKKKRIRGCQKQKSSWNVFLFIKYNKPWSRFAQTLKRTSLELKTKNIDIVNFLNMYKKFFFKQFLGKIFIYISTNAANLKNTHFLWILLGVIIGTPHPIWNIPLRYGRVLLNIATWNFMFRIKS